MDNNIHPDISIGDFDSLSYIPKGNKTYVFPAEKDETDTFLAVTEGLKSGYTFFVILGGLGGDRFDHSLANIQTLAYISKNGGRGVLLSKKLLVTAIHNDYIKLPERNSGYISIFSLDEVSQNVTIQGLKYSVQNCAIASAFPIGVSNEFVGKEASVSVENGTLLITMDENLEKYLENL